MSIWKASGTASIEIDRLIASIAAGVPGAVVGLLPSRGVADGWYGPRTTSTASRVRSVALRDRGRDGADGPARILSSSAVLYLVPVNSAFIPTPSVNNSSNQSASQVPFISAPERWPAMFSPYVKMRCCVPSEQRKFRYSCSQS